jgi:geranylgeranylglycerol-phosphate geranylgeranyltransferase
MVNGQRSTEDGHRSSDFCHLSSVICYLNLTRPLNVAITFASVLIAGVISRPFAEINAIALSLGALAAGLIAGFGNVHNDICDIEVDKINRPERPLPSGKISLRSANTFTNILVIAGNALGAVLGWIPMVITLAATFLLSWYNRKLKMIPLWGNIAVSGLTALAFIFGGILVGNMGIALIPAIFSLLFHFSREMVKDIEDISGDRVRPGATFAQKYGIQTSCKVTAVVLAILFLIIPLPYLFDLFNLRYFLVSGMGVEIPLLVCIILLEKKALHKLRLISKLLKLGMVMGLLALLVGK